MKARTGTGISPGLPVKKCRVALSIVPDRGNPTAHVGAVFEYTMKGLGKFVFSPEI
jgi:hypothetical protein